MQINLGRGPGGANENCMRKKVDKVPIAGSENLIFHPPMGIPPRHREWNFAVRWRIYGSRRSVIFTLWTGDGMCRHIDTLYTAKDSALLMGSLKVTGHPNHSTTQPSSHPTIQLPIQPEFFLKAKRQHGWWWCVMINDWWPESGKTPQSGPGILIPLVCISVYCLPFIFAFVMSWDLFECAPATRKMCGKNHFLPIFSRTFLSQSPSVSPYGRYSMPICLPLFICFPLLLFPPKKKWSGAFMNGHSVKYAWNKCLNYECERVCVEKLGRNMERVPFDGGEGVEGNRFLSRVHREWERLSVSFNNAPLTVCTHTFAYSFVICIKGCF